MGDESDLLGVLAAARRETGAQAERETPAGALGPVISAARRRDPGGLAAAIGPALPQLATDPDLHHVVVWCAYHTVGVTAAAALRAAGPDRPPSPDRWAGDARFIDAQAALLDYRPPRLQLAISREGRSVALRTQLGLPVLDVVVGSAAATFVLDTGAPTSVVTPRFAREARARLAPESARQVTDGAGRHLDVLPAAASRLQIGDMTLSPAPLSVIDLPSELGIDGILSPTEAFREATFDINGPEAMLTVSSTPDFVADLAEHAANPRSGSVHSVELRWGEGTPTLLADVDGQSRSLMMDSGASASFLCENLIPSDSTATSRLITAAGDSRAGATIAATVRVADGAAETFRFHAKPCDEPDGDEILSLELDGILGWPWLAARRTWWPGGSHLIFSAR